MPLSLRRFLPALFAGPSNGSANGKKALTAMRHDGRQSSGVEILLPQTKVDYAREVGDGMGSSVLMACLNFLMRTFPEAPPIVEKFRAEEWKQKPDHDLIALLRRPNPFYSGRTLWMATVLDFAFGNAYWLKIRNADGKVVQLWWVPRATMTPRWDNDGKSFITHYEYRPGQTSADGRTLVSVGGGVGTRVDVKDVVHFRFGIDPNNPRLGLSQLGSLMREIAVDDIAAGFTASVFNRLGVIGVVISPEGEGQINDEDVKATKEYVKSAFTGDQRGDPLVLGAPTKVQLLQYNLQGFDTAPVRDVSEERVCAALGLPAAVIGFGTGLHQTKVGATMKEMRQLAWTGGIIPMQEVLAEDMDLQLLPEFETGEHTRVRFDTSRVRALWEDNNEKHTRVREDYKAKLIDRAEARRETGRTPRPEDEGVYFSGPQPTDSQPNASEPTTPQPSGDEDDDDAAEAA